MRQAILIKNPKWIPFSEASADYKSASGDVVLVERNLAREKRGKSKKEEAKVK